MQSGRLRITQSGCGLECLIFIARNLDY